LRDFLHFQILSGFLLFSHYDKTNTSPHNHQPLKIGYLGGGLYPDPRQKCLYHGTGMRFDAPDWVWVRQDGRKGLYPHLDKP